MQGYVPNEIIIIRNIRNAFRITDDTNSKIIHAIWLENSLSKKTTKTKLWFYGIISIFVVPICALLAVEYTLRLFDVGYPTQYLIPSHQPNQVTTNQKFGWRFFPPAIARKPALFSLQTPKPKNTYRIFILGGSAALGVPQPGYSVSRILEQMLQAQNPDVDFEVINAAMVAINSHVVLPIIQECQKYEPDLFVVYMGNNEVVGPYGAGSILGNHTANLTTIRLGLWLRSWRIGQLTDQFIQALTTPNTQAQSSWQGMEMFLEHQISQDDPRLQTVYNNFEQNLNDILLSANNTPIFLCTVGVNLTSCAPFASKQDTTLAPSKQTAWQEAYDRGIIYLQESKYTQALAQFHRAEKIDPDHADLQFQIAKSYYQQQDREEAKKHFLAARDKDALRFRADSQINDIIRKTATTHSNTELVDIDMIMRDGNSLPGRHEFYEHVHLTFEGNYLIAKSLYENILPILSPNINEKSQNVPTLHISECADRLVLTPWARFQNQRKILSLTSRPPFTYQSNYIEQRTQNLEILNNLRKTGQTGSALQLTQEQLEQALISSPHDIYFRLLLADVYTRKQPPELDKAQQQVQYALSLYPNDTNLLTFSAEVYEHQGQISKALVHHQRVLQIDPSKTNAHLSIAHIQTQQGAPEKARQSYKTALELAPRDHTVLTHYGNFLHQTKQYKESLNIYRTGLDIALKEDNREYQGIYNQKLGAFFLSQQNTSAALKHFTQAADIFSHAAYPEEEADTYQQIGHLYFSIGQLEKALDNFGQAHNLLQAIKSPAQIGVLTNMGNLYIHQKQYDPALQFHKKAAHLSSVYQDIQSEANALTNVGICYLNLGNNTRAEKALRTAQTKYQQIEQYDRVQQTQQLLRQLTR